MSVWQLLAMNPRKINFFGRINLFAFMVGSQWPFKNFPHLNIENIKRKKIPFYFLILNSDKDDLYIRIRKIMKS